MSSLPEDLKRNAINLSEIKKNDIIFQALTWHGDDFMNFKEKSDEDEEEEEPDENVNENGEYQVYIHGVTLDGITVCTRV